MSLYVIMLVFVYMFIFWFISMYERKHAAFVFLSLAYFT
jgi:hypothetical protein